MGVDATQLHIVPVGVDPDHFRPRPSVARVPGRLMTTASADMVLLSHELKHLVTGIHTARKTLRVIKQNLAWAVLYNLTALPLAALGFVAPWMAALGMSGSSLLVVANALRLNRARGK
jgi:Cu2+-exporting ATPase